jgi:hypothetical protein
VDPDFLSEAGTRVGATLCGKYRLDSILGVGGMATVYAATHRNRAELAVKVLHRELASDPSVRARFLREAYAVNSIKHRGVVKIVDDDIAEDGSAFLVMDRLEGETAEGLRDRNDGRVPLEAAVSIGEQLLDALRAAHAEGVVHRDVKPANLFVTNDGDVRVLDFGIARTREALASGLSLTGAVTIMGTPTYMAPEQALPGMTEIDERTDVWAAGATLFALLSGRPVHEAGSVGDLLARAAMNPAPSLASIMPRAPRAIVEVVDLALAFEKAGRWASAEDMRTALLAAHRFHFGRGPSRASLARLVGPPSRGAAPVDRAHAHTVPSFPGGIAQTGDHGARPAHGGSSAPAPGREQGLSSRGSRTSIPIAFDAKRLVEVAGGRGGLARTVVAAAVAIAMTLAVLRMSRDRPGGGQSAGAPLCPFVDAAVLTDAQVAEEATARPTASSRARGP